MLRIDGVFKFVGVRGQGTPIPEAQIDAVRTLIGAANTLERPSLSQDRTAGSSPQRRAWTVSKAFWYLAMDDSTLVVSIDAIQRSLAVRIEGYDVEPL